MEINILRILNNIADTLEALLPESLNKLFVPVRRLIGDLFTSWKKGLLARIRFYINAGHVIRKHKVNKYFAESKVKKLQLGGGVHPKNGWLNADIIYGDVYLDATKTFPFPSSSFDYIFAEHFIEHFDFKTGQHIIKECNRVLKSGGKIRLSTPDLNKLVSLYKNENPFVTRADLLNRHNRINKKTLKTMAEYFNDMYRMWGHKFIYDYEILRILLNKCNFKNIKTVKFGKSSDTNLKNLERHADVKWMEDGYVIIVEATNGI